MEARLRVNTHPLRMNSDFRANLDPDAVETAYRDRTPLLIEDGQVTGGFSVQDVQDTRWGWTVSVQPLPERPQSTGWA